MAWYNTSASGNTKTLALTGLSVPTEDPVWMFAMLQLSTGTSSYRAAMGFSTDDQATDNHYVIYGGNTSMGIEGVLVSSNTATWLGGIPSGLTADTWYPVLTQWKGNANGDAVFWINSATPTDTKVGVSVTALTRRRLVVGSNRVDTSNVYSENFMGKIAYAAFGLGILTQTEIDLLMTGLYTPWSVVDASRLHSGWKLISNATAEIGSNLTPTGTPAYDATDPGLIDFVGTRGHLLLLGVG